MRDAAIEAQHLINGQPLSTISVVDRGFLYGDGVFETLRVSQGKCIFWKEHIKRLEQGCEVLGLPRPDSELLQREMQQLVGKQSGVAKIIVTRGEGERGYQLPAIVRATRVLSFFPGNPEKKREAKARICQLRLSHQPALAGIKHLNRLEHIIARAEWQDPSIKEGILMDTQGRVISGTMTNLFCVKNERLYTPKIDNCGVKGIAREEIIAYCHKKQIPCEEKNISLAELISSDEIMVCNSVKGITAITAIQEYDKQFTTHFIEQHISQALAFS